MLCGFTYYGHRVTPENADSVFKGGGAVSSHKLCSLHRRNEYARPAPTLPIKLNMYVNMQKA